VCAIFVPLSEAVVSDYFNGDSPDCACVSIDAASPQLTRVFQAGVLGSDANARRC